MSWLSLRRVKAEGGFTFLEMLFALAIMSFVCLALINMQWQAFDLAIAATATNAAEQVLDSISNRLMINLPGADQIELIPTDGIAPPMLKITEELANGTRVRFYYLMANGNLYEHAEWESYTGSGVMPQPYTTPLASTLTEFEFTIQYLSKGTLLYLTIASGDSTREFTIWLRNVRF